MGKKKQKNRKKSVRKLEGWCRRHNIGIIGVHSKTEKMEKETIKKINS